MRAVFLALLCATAALADGPAKKRVAVLDFDNAAVQSGPSIPFMTMSQPNFGKAVADMLVTRLVQDGAVSVIERSRIAALLSEQDFSNSDRTDPATAAKLGRILGVDAMIVGAITRYDYEDKTTGGGSHAPIIPHNSMSTKHDIKAHIQISARLVSPDTAEVVAVADGSGEVLQKGVKVDLRDSGRVMMQGSSNSPVVSDAMNKAVAQLAAAIEQNIPKIPPRAPVIDGLVADANESGRLVLNVGAQQGVKVGDRLQVWRAGKEIRDPASGKVLMRDDTLLGEAVVSTVNDISSIAAYKGTETVKTGDLVKSPPKQ